MLCNSLPNLVFFQGVTACVLHQGLVGSNHSNIRSVFKVISSQTHVESVFQVIFDMQGVSLSNLLPSMVHVERIS